MQNSDNLRLINIGFGNMVSAAHLLAIVAPDSAPIKRIIQDTPLCGQPVAAIFGRLTLSVIIMDCVHVIFSAVQPETVAGRVGGKGDKQMGGDEDDG
ncbi:MAG: DUF370 domain-containing protein [Oscillospiraceae bacterium]|nr:DUF370 domain-containing protein [Oscillospiraceae bacterium]